MRTIKVQNEMTNEPYLPSSLLDSAPPKTAQETRKSIALGNEILHFCSTERISLIQAQKSKERKRRIRRRPQMRPKEEFKSLSKAPSSDALFGFSDPSIVLTAAHKEPDG